MFEYFLWWAFYHGLKNSFKFHNLIENQDVQINLVLNGLTGKVETLPLPFSRRTGNPWLNIKTGHAHVLFRQEQFPAKGGQIFPAFYRTISR